MTLEDILHDQVSRISSPSNHELLDWWNWKPKRFRGSNLYDSHSSNNEEEIQAKSYCLDKICSAASETSFLGENKEDVQPLHIPDLRIPMSIVVADMHNQVIGSCQSEFSSLGLPVTLVHDPMQTAILEAMHTSEHNITFVVFGGYGSGECHSGLQKQLMECFPHQMRELKEQAMVDATGDGSEIEANMSNQGKAWLSDSPVVTPSGLLYLVSCAAYPRGQSPSEQEHVRRMFERALSVIQRRLVQGVGSGVYGGASYTVRIITHAIGSFVGHPDPGVFGWGLAHGLNDFLAT